MFDHLDITGLCEVGLVRFGIVFDPDDNPAVLRKVLKQLTEANKLADEPKKGPSDEGNEAEGQEAQTSVPVAKPKGRPGRKPKA